MNESGDNRFRRFVCRRRTLLRRVSAVVIIAALVVIARSLPVEQTVDGVKSRVEQMGAAGPVVVGVLFVLVSFVALPIWPLNVVAGALFGPVGGTATISAASVVGATLAFLAARYLARERVAQYIARSPRLSALDSAVEEASWKVVAAVRLIHVMPFGLQNYLLGLTGIHFRTFLFTSWLVMLPGTFLYAYAGYLGGVGLEALSRPGRGESLAFWAVRLAGFAVAASVAVAVMYMIRKAIKDKLSDEQRAAFSPEPHSGAETTADPDRAVWPWGTLAATTFAAALAALAGWSATHQDALKQIVERTL
jgi:uncharacterized membrane protein YdjX (TVP38/TMEM64 family)